MANVVPLFDSKTPAAQATGKVILVGAGPGDPGLLTRKAFAALTTADILFYDDLVSAEILAEVPPSVRRVYVGKPNGAAKITQEEIISLLADAARTYAHVVRLKGGDPLIFGRGGEEIEGLRLEGISVDVIPGITAAQGAASTTHIPLTHRDHSAQIAYVTAVRRDGALADFRNLAGEGKTLVVYMGLGKAAEISAALKDDGIPGDFPVAIVENATRPGERRFVTTVDQMAALVAAKAVRSPALLLIGKVATAASARVHTEDTAVTHGEFNWVHFAHG